MRAKVKARLIDGMIHVVVDWIEVVNNVPGSVLYTEEFKLPTTSESAYVSRMEVIDSMFQQGTFWLDGQGRRHFFMGAEPSDVQSILSPAGTFYEVIR